MLYNGVMNTTQTTATIDTHAFCDGCDGFLPVAELGVNDDGLLVCEMCK